MILDEDELAAAVQRLAIAGWARIGAAEAEEVRRFERDKTRRYWSGPDRLERRILRAFRVSVRVIDVPRSAFDGRYRIRQRNRRRRRR